YFLYLTLPPPRSTLFPYTTLFRSSLARRSWPFWDTIVTSINAHLLGYPYRHGAPVKAPALQSLIQKQRCYWVKSVPIALLQEWFLHVHVPIPFHSWSGK